jgi:hypothetical protein
MTSLVTLLVATFVRPEGFAFLAISLPLPPVIHT